MVWPRGNNTDVGSRHDVDLHFAGWVHGVKVAFNAKGMTVEPARQSAQDRLSGDC